MQRGARGGGQLRYPLEAQHPSVDHEAARDPHERLGTLDPPHRLEDGLDVVADGFGAASRLQQAGELERNLGADAQAGHAFDGAADPVVVRREVDVRAGLRHGHQGYPVAGAQALDERAGGAHDVAPLPERDALLVDQDHDEPPGVRVGVGRVRGVLRPGIGWPGAPRRRPQGDELRLDDGARLPVDGHREICRLQVRNRVALAVEHGGVKLDELDAGTEHGRLLGRERHAQGGDDDLDRPEPRPSSDGHGISSVHSSSTAGLADGSF